MGNLIKRVEDGSSTTTYVQDLNSGLPVVLIEETSSYTAKYTYGKDRLKVSRSGEYYYFYDGLGSTRTITNTSGTVKARYVYDVYGKPISSECHEDASVSGQPFLFTGELYDSDVEHIYLRARWYDPNTGRFITRDEYEGRNDKPNSLHRYGYCGGEPVNHSDPSGYFTFVQLVAATAIVAVLAAGYIGIRERSFGAFIDVFKGYGDNLNPIMAYRSMQALYALAKDEGIGAAGHALLIGMKGAYTNWWVTDDPREFGRSFGVVLVTIAALVAPYAESGAMAGAAGGTAGKEFVLAGRGSTGRFVPKNLTEQLTMREILSNPTNGKVLRDIKMNDIRWPSSEGWVKMQHSHTVPATGEKIVIHYLRKGNTNIFDDFKYVNPK